MFELFEYSQPNEDGDDQPPKTWNGAFYAIAIGPDSELDGVVVNGEPVTIGRPLLLKGQLSAFTIREFRATAGMVRLVGITAACGLAAIARARHARRYYLRGLTGEIELRVPFAGRKRAAIYVACSLNTASVVIQGRSYAAPSAEYPSSSYEIIQPEASLVNVADIGGSGEDGWVVEDETYDDLIVTVDGGAGSSEIYVEVTGEAGA